MGERGPTPRRNSGRLRKNRDGKNVEIVRQADVQVPRPRPEWHPEARLWFAGLEASPQARLFQESDWAYAILVAGQISDYQYLPPGQRQPAMWAQIAKAQDQLLVTHAARLRARVEVHDAGADPGEAELPANMIDIRAGFRARKKNRDDDSAARDVQPDSNAAQG